MEKRRSACPLDCPDLCGLEVTVDNGRVIEVNGDRRGPITDGFVCGKVRKFAQHMYGEHRVLKPRVRAGAKGDGRWREVSWDEALDIVVGRLTEIRAVHGAEAILPYHYGGSNGWLTEGSLATRFFRRLGATTLDRTYCAAATTAAAQGMYGKLPGIPIEDYVHAKVIVLWGINLSATGIHAVPIITKAREQGAKLVVIDPRATPLARQADLHLAIKPGTDLPVALAVINALFQRGHADRAFLAEHAMQVDELERRASAWTIDAAAREAGIDPAQLDEFVEMYAAASPAALRCGYGVERNRNGGSAVAAVLAIPAVAGKFGVRGGGYTMSNSDVKWETSAEKTIATPLPGTRVVNMSRLSVALDELRDPRIHCLFVYNCNPASTAPDQLKVIEHLEREDLFVVVHEQVMTDTAELADIVLPATTFLEHRELRRGYGVSRMFDSPAVADPVGESRSNNQLFGALAERMGLVQEGDAISEDDILARALPERLKAQLREHEVALPVVEVPFVDVFPPNKIQLVSPELDRESGGLYVYKPNESEYPLALISPALATQISSYFGQLHDGPAHLELARSDAEMRGIRDGDLVRMWNERGEVRVLAKVVGTVRPGVCVLPKGLWRKHTQNGNTANALIAPGIADLGGQAAYNDARVQVERITS